MCFPADMPPELMNENDGRWNKSPKFRDWFSCDICGSKVGVRIIEQRIRWGAAVRRGIGTGYTCLPIPWCVACRKKRGSHKFKYHVPK